MAPPHSEANSASAVPTSGQGIFPGDQDSPPFDPKLISELELFRFLLQNSPDQIYFKDRQGRFLWASSEVAKNLGVAHPSELVGKTDRDFTGAAWAEEAALDESRIIQTGEPIVGKIEKMEQAGDSVQATHTTKLPLRNLSGEIIGICGINKDITALTKAEESLLLERNNLQAISAELHSKNRELSQSIAERERAENEREEMLHALALKESLLDSMMSTSLDTIYFKDLQHRFIRISNSLARDFGLSDPSHAVGKSDFDFFPAEEAGGFQAEEKQVMETGEPMIVRDVKPSRGAPWVSTTKIPLRDAAGKIVGIYGINRDITERKCAQELLQKTLQDLERSNKELEQFAYVASHDLLEPLRLVSAYSQLLLKRYRDKLDSEADPLVNFINEGIRRMQQLIHDLLAYSRVGSQQRPFATHSSEKILEDALCNLAVAVSEKQATITHDPLPEVFCEPSQLSRVFQNLIGNALKFQGDHPPRIHVGAEKSPDGLEWVFSVRDNGIGIEPEYYEKIFVIFQRLHTRSKYSGTGIGLSICKRVVELHGGRIWVDSAKGKGTTFFFSIPLALERSSS